MTMFLCYLVYAIAFAVGWKLMDSSGTGRRNTRLVARLSPVLALALLACLAPDLAFAQDAVPAEDGAGAAFDWAVIAVVVLVVIESAKRIAAVIPGRKADEFEGYLGVAELFVRKIVDFVAGRSKHPEDQSAVKHE